MILKYYTPYRRWNKGKHQFLFVLKILQFHKNIFFFFQYNNVYLIAAIKSSFKELKKMMYCVRNIAIISLAFYLLILCCENHDMEESNSRQLE